MLHTFVQELLNQMTLEEKAGQMTQLTITSLIEYTAPGKPVKPLQLKSELPFTRYQIGSVLNVPEKSISQKEWRALLQLIQQAAAKTDKKIPVLYGLDSVHGANYVMGATLFPQQINQAATFNPELVKQAASITAYETRAAGVPWNFSPVQDIARNPLWPRLWETFGEDVHLCQQLGKASVEGMQGTAPDHPEKVAATLKHFAGYGFPLSGKDRTPAWIPERYLREYFLPPFQTAIDAGAAAIMINSGEINGVPVHADYFLLTSILRHEMGFKGVVVTDWQDIIYLHTSHRITSNNRESVKKAIMAGVDMSMVPFDFSFTDDLIALVKDGEIPMSRINEATGRILQLKYDLGLFKDAMPQNKGYRGFGSKNFVQLNQQLARESLVLLKNENSRLPLPPNARVLLCGLAADSLHALNGGWTHTWQGTDYSIASSGKKTILEALQKQLGDRQVEYVQGASFSKEINIQAAVQQARTCDYILACVGEAPYTENVGNTNELALPVAQLNLVKAMAATGKPVILVLVQGRPRVIHEIADLCDGILLAMLPGDEGAEAVIDVLFGKFNPCGKLPFTYPRYANCLVPYDHKFTDTGHKDYDFEEFQPLFEFGHGLAYTDYEYTELRLSQKNLKMSQQLQISLKVRNRGVYAGQEVVLLYIQDMVASITPPVKRLRGFKKVALKPQETTTVHFKISAADLSFIGLQNRPVTEPGEFRVTTGSLEAFFMLEEDDQSQI